MILKKRITLNSEELLEAVQDFFSKKNKMNLMNLEVESIKEVTLIFDEEISIKSFNFLNSPIEELPFGGKVLKEWRSDGIKTMRDLLEEDRNCFILPRGFADKSMETLDKIFSENGFNLKHKSRFNRS